MNAMRTSLVVAALLAGAAAAAAAQDAPARRTAPRMPHPAAGKADCLSCHAPNANAHIRSTPAAHRFANGACAMCHRPLDKTPPNSVHPFNEARADCRTCHAPNSPSGAKPTPDWHATYDEGICALCHQPGQGN